MVRKDFWLALPDYTARQKHLAAAWEALGVRRHESFKSVLFKLKRRHEIVELCLPAYAHVIGLDPKTLKEYYTQYSGRILKHAAPVPRPHRREMTARRTIGIWLRKLADRIGDCDPACRIAGERLLSVLPSGRRAE